MVPASLISVNNVNTFKSRLDKFSVANQLKELISDYESTLTGSRSFVDSIDNSIFLVS